MDKSVKDWAKSVEEYAALQKKTFEDIEKMGDRLRLTILLVVLLGLLISGILTFLQVNKII